MKESLNKNETNACIQVQEVQSNLQIFTLQIFMPDDHRCSYLIALKQSLQFTRYLGQADNLKVEAFLCFIWCWLKFLSFEKFLKWLGRLYLKVCFLLTFVFRMDLHTVFCLERYIFSRKKIEHLHGQMVSFCKLTMHLLCITFLFHILN